MGDPNLRDMIYWIFNKLKSGNFGNSGGGSGGITQTQLDNALDDKVDKVPGKGLSTNDYTTEDKNKINLVGNKLDKGSYIGTAEDLKNAIDTVNSKTIHWNDIQNKPSLDFIPTSWNKKNNKEVIRTQVDGWLRLNDNNTHEDGVYLGESVVRTDGQLQVGANGNVFKTHNEANGEGIILGNKIKIRTRPDNNHIAFGDTEWTKLVYGEFAGIKIWNNADNNKVVLAGGGVKPLSELDNKNIKVGGKNLLRDSGRRIANNNYNIAIYELTEYIEQGELVTLTIKGHLGNGKTVFAAYNSNDFLELTQLYDKGDGIYQNTFDWKKIHNDGRIADNKTLYIWTYLGNITVESTIEWIKLERGNTPTDWTPAPEDILEQRTIYVDSPTFDVTAYTVGKTVHINRDCTIHYNDMPLLSTICFRKVYDGGQIRFHGGGTLKYTGDTVFNGNSGSTAVLDMSADINRIYIDIRNV